MAYLASFAKTAAGPGALRGINLRTTAGTWKAAQELCIDVPSADRGSVLCKEHRDALGQVVRSGRNQQIAQAARHTFGSSVERIRNYFAPWLRRSSGIRAQAGVVVTLLAGMTELKAEAAEMLAPHSREWVLSQIPWPNAWTGQPLDGLAPAEAIGGCTVHFTAEDVTDISCVSITGDRLRVPAEKKARNLLIGTPQFTQVIGGTVAYEVRFRNLDVNAFSNAELSKVLRATAEDLVRYVYLRGVTDLNALWGKLDRTEQLHLETAEKLILEYLPFYLGQIRPAGAPTLVRKLAEIEDLRRLRIEHEDAEGKTREYQAQRAALGRMLKDDAEAQRAVLNAVRARLRDMEYQPGSVAFELFQNADDAYLQYSEIHLAGVTRAQRKNRFIILVDDGAVSFLHWGRPINYVGPAGFDGRERGYHRDLERMLTLSGSDKQDAVATGRRVTGKFGLGFKSVLLACDQPEVGSGGLEFEIRAGVLPKSLSPDRAADLRGLVQKWSGPEPVPGTIIRLPAAEPSLPSAILDEFRRNAGCLCAFSSSIREISIVDSVGQQSAVWDGLKVAGNAWIETGRLPFGDESVNALRIEIEDAVVLLGLGAEGIVDLPRDTPAVWVTCPTREDQHFGFAVCGRFDVDPGRARLSRNTKNIEQAVRIGALLGERLRELRLARWEVLRKALDLGPAATEYDFWASLWRLFQRTIAQPESAVASILKPILGGAIRALARDLAVVPNGLPGAARTLTTGPKLRHKMAGAFSIDEAVEPLFNWAESKRRGYAPDSVISANNSAGLGQIGVDRVASISLASVGSWLDHQTVSPQDAAVLGSVLRALPKEDDRTHEVAEDLRRAKAALEHVQFRSASKTSERARDLVAAGCGEEEARRAAFAPENRRLSPEYGELALWFFRFCRGPMAAKASDLAQWAKQAGDPVSQRAVLVYLVRGELGLEFRRQLAALGTEGSWLNELSRDELPEELRDDLLRPPVQVREPLPAHVRVADPLQALLRIERWWQCHAGRETQEYNRRVYPQGQTPRLQAPWEEDFDRSQWLILFGRAVFYRAGRATDAQHRGFIEMSQHHGFWSVYSAGDPRGRADEWMNVLERFCADQVEGGEWEHWMRFFPHFYKLSRWLEDYAELFLRLGELDRRYDLTAVLTSRTDPNQQGGGISAPPPNLGIGACFVVRELLRLGKLNSRFAHMHAFVPTGGVRELLDRLGLRVDDIPNVAISGQIYEELTNYLGPDRATFDMAFDIPFQIIAANQDLENQLVWEHHADQRGA